MAGSWSDQKVVEDVRRQPPRGCSFDDAKVFHRAMRAAAATKMGRVVFRPTAHRLDQLVSRLTGGRRSLSRIAAGLPAVILTTIGAKSGKPRTVVLMGILHPDGVAVVATNYGDAKHRAGITTSRPTRRPP
jgi:hypothetical protein